MRARNHSGQEVEKGCRAHPNRERNQFLQVKRNPPSIRDRLHRNRELMSKRWIAPGRRVGAAEPDRRHEESVSHAPAWRERTKGTTLRLPPHGPYEGRQAGDDGRQRDDHGGIENKHKTTPSESIVPYLFPACNRKFPITGEQWLTHWSEA
jgi:hypothetical protein